MTDELVTIRRKDLERLLKNSHNWKALEFKGVGYLLVEQALRNYAEKHGDMESPDFLDREVNDLVIRAS